MKVNEIRRKFLEYFAENGHTIVPSSSLIPHNDPTLLFTNAGMNQFKDVFLGFDKRNYVRATSSQKCVRAGGKHNDLNNVGYTARHHTFFEMLGNFSFGDYFKHDAIKFAWEFLTKVLNLPKEKLYVTVYHTDNEAFDLWHNVIALSSDRIIRIGDKSSGGSDNFWQMGETGPCGPCTEIFYDHGEDIWGGLPGSPDEDGDRFIEIWNCVFMQFNRDEKGQLHPLPKPSVDTGMGLERISAVMQNVHSNYEIDLFVELIGAATKIIQCKDLDNNSLKVLADHIRSVSFLIADGAIPSNEGRGYVLRRIIRRAIRHGYKLGCRSPFFYQLVNELVKQMGSSYPKLISQQETIKQVILQEEDKFFQTIDNGMQLLLAELKNRTALGDVFSGEVAFKLYDTYGFPLDLTEDMCREYNLMVDKVGFDKCMQNQKNMAKASGKFKISTTVDYTGTDTNFIGYDDTIIQSKIVAIYVDNQSVTKLNHGESGVIVLDQTVFYAESGGQVGDTGVIQSDGSIPVLFTINDTQKIRPQVFGHIGTLVHGSLMVGDKIFASYDLHQRLKTARNHSATHLLHRALHQVIGVHAVQKGSLVNSSYIRFDFANDKGLTEVQIEEIEIIVNNMIMMNYPVVIKLMKYDEAIKYGAMALFGEKYTDEVRIIQMGDFSIELCGGTHVRSTGDIGLFTITSETGIANGIRRIEAITGEVAIKQMQKNMAILSGLRNSLKAQNNKIIEDKVITLIKENKQLNKQIDELQVKQVLLQSQQYLCEAVLLSDGHQLLVIELSDTDNKTMLTMVDWLKHKLGSSIVVIGSKNVDKVHLVVGVTLDLVTKYNANSIIKYLANIVGGKGGGRPDLAQAGGNQVDKLSEALASVHQFINLS